MKKFTNLLIVASLALAGAVMAQQPSPDESQPPGKKTDKKAPAEVKPPKAPHAPKTEAPAAPKTEAPAAPKSEAPKVKEPAAAAQPPAASEPAVKEPVAPKQDKKAPKNKKETPPAAPSTNAEKPAPNATGETPPATKEERNAKNSKKAPPAANTSPSAAPAAPKTAASPAATTATTPATTPATVTTPATTPVTATTPATTPATATTPAAAASVSAAPSVAQTNAAGPKKKPDPQKIEQIRQQHTSFRAQARPDRVPAVTFSAGFRLPGVETWSGPRYEVYRSYHPERHDRGWYSSRYQRVELIAGGYYYFNSGYWYPAWGYDSGHEYYAYDAPIYAGKHAEPPDKVIADVQAALQEMGYYKGEVDGLIGPLTRDALTGYQRDNGITVTAVIDEPTLDALGMS